MKYPKPPGEEEAGYDTIGFGVRIGIIARDAEDEAWAIAHERFPEDRKGQIAHSLAMRVSDPLAPPAIAARNRDNSGR